MFGKCESVLLEHGEMFFENYKKKIFFEKYVQFMKYMGSKKNILIYSKKHTAMYFEKALLYNTIIQRNNKFTNTSRACG